MASTETTPAVSVSKDKKITLPLALLASLLGAGAMAYARLAGTEDKVERHTQQIQALEAEARATREILIRIDENVKDLRRSQRRADNP